ncbi:MAG: type II secretion system F family protein [Gemmataceae bacterium]
MFSSQLSLSTLTELCRVLRHYLGAGLTLPEAFRQQEKKGPASIRSLAGRVADRLESGDSLEDALHPEAESFPPLMLALSSVGERTGMLPEIFQELERHFLRQSKLRRDFQGRIAWPVVQFILAVFVLAGLIFIMGQLGPSDPSKKFDPLGLGLFGASGAMIFLGVIFGTIGGIFLVYFLSSRLLGGKAAMDRFLLRVPALGPCLQSLALSRFCLALRLTTESGMSIAKALRLSLEATGNQAFVEAYPVVKETVARGDDVTLALSRTGLFTDEFLRIVEVGEEAGTLSESMRHQANHYHEESSTRLAILTSVAGYGIWMMIGIFIIIAIFRIYGSYIGMLNQF